VDRRKSSSTMGEACEGESLSLHRIGCSQAKLLWKKDTELWDPEGDALVYFGRQYQEAAFRVHSSILRRTGSHVFLRMLKEGLRAHDGDSTSTDDSIVPVASHLMASPVGTSSDGSSVTSSKATFGVFRNSSKVKSKKTYSTLSLSTGDMNGGDIAAARYWLYFPAPPRMSRAATIRYHLTTRNVFAMLLNKALVGLDFAQALKDLQKRLQEYMSPEVNCAKLMVRYMVARQLHNVSNSPAMAAGLLSWCEEPSVRWQEGWREAFVHCCGMYPRLSASLEWESVSQVSRGLLENAHEEMQSRIRWAEDRLLTFKFDDFWGVEKVRHHPARTGFNTFRTFLREHFDKSYKAWRARVNEEHCADSWLTRELVNKLQEDHGALYEFLVDRDMTWASSSAVMRNSTGPDASREIHNTSVATLLDAFDLKHGYTSILHPYPLLPVSVPVEANNDSNASHRVSLSPFGSRASRARDKRVAQAYAVANNIKLVDSNIRRNHLVEAFRKYELSDNVRQMDPRDARKGRWMLLYCTLQVLAGISVDTPHLFFTDVPYFLNPRLKNTPPWAGRRQELTGARTVVGVYDEASRLLSHCWLSPKTWGADNTSPVPSAKRQELMIKSYTTNTNSVRKNTSRAALTTDLDVKDPEDTFTFDPDCATDDDDVDLEQVGLPGFRAPLKARSQAFGATATQAAEADSNLQNTLARKTSNLAGGDVGKSDYAPPQEW
jgi:hypothetical protein